MKQRFIRTGDTLADTEIVVRGGELVAAAVRRDAMRMRDVYGAFGISVFAFRGTTIDELAQSSPLVRLTTLTVGAPSGLPCSRSRQWVGTLSTTPSSCRTSRMPSRNLSRGVGQLLMRIYI